MILTNSTSSKVGATNVNAIASATAAFRQFMVYAATTISQAITGSVGLIKNGTGTLTLTANNTYTGATTINAGTLQIGNNSPASIVSTSIVNNADLIYSTNIASGTSSLASSTTGTGNLTATALLIKLNGNITQSGNVILTGSTAGIFFGSGIELVADTTIAAGNITITGDLGRRTANGGNLTLNTSATNGAINLDASISRSGVWYGFTTFTANAGTGNLTVSGLNASNALWTATSGLNLSGTLIISSNLNIVISALNLTATGNSSVTGNLSLSATTNTLTVNPSLTMTVSGNISGTNAAVTKNGTGALFLDGNLTYTGATDIAVGTLRAKKTVGASTATATFTGGGTTLSVAFNVPPPSAATTNFRFFQGTTTQTYSSITLTGVPVGTTATYTSATSTLAVTVP
jgi:autotransporter-associated beta strand protein